MIAKAVAFFIYKNNLRILRMKCPRCNKNDIRPYGYIKVRNHGFVEKVRRYRCEDCLKQFTKNSHKKESIW